MADHDDITTAYKTDIQKTINKKLVASATDVRIRMNGTNFSICRVPSRFASGKELYYEPSIIAFGPYHRGKEKFRAMEEYKWLHFKAFGTRKIEDFIVQHIQKLAEYSAQQAQKYYFEPMNMQNSDVVKMLLLDGCFIVETILRWRDQCPLISYNSLSARQIWEDLLLFENQIPFFILEDLYNAVQTNDNEGWVFIVIQYMRDRVLPREMKANISLGPRRISHLLQLFYHCCVSEQSNSTQTEIRCLVDKLFSLLKWLNPLRLMSKFLSVLARNNRSQEGIKIPTATKLKEAGVTFKAKESDNFMDITFNHGVLKIPSIILDFQRTCRMMNLIVFEQANSRICTSTSYAEFMNCIIDTDNDVEILKQAGIIISYLKNNEEIALFFNRLNEKGALDFNHILTPVMKNINEYVAIEWHEWRAYLRGNYFRNPWVIFSLVAAGFLLIFTFLQTFYSIYSYYHPRS